MKKILMIVGSRRKKSFNAQLSENIAGLIGDRAEVKWLDYKDVPFLDQDIEDPVPESVARARAAVMEADGIWICSPEYNFNIPGGLKNVLDWLSRPLIPGDRSSGSALKGKPVTISGAAGRSGAAGVRRSLEGLLKIIASNPVGGVGTGISLDAEAYKSDILTLSEENIAALRQQADEFISALS